MNDRAVGVSLVTLSRRFSRSSNGSNFNTCDSAQRSFSQPCDRRGLALQCFPVCLFGLTGSRGMRISIGRLGVRGASGESCGGLAKQGSYSRNTTLGDADVVGLALNVYEPPLLVAARHPGSS